MSTGVLSSNFTRRSPRDSAHGSTESHLHRELTFASTHIRYSECVIIFSCILLLTTTSSAVAIVFMYHNSVAVVISY